MQQVAHCESYGGKGRTPGVEVFLFSMGATIVAGWMTLNLWFLHAGSAVPDPIAGRTYPVQELGTIYIIPLWGHLSSLLCFVGFAAMALAAGAWVIRAVANKLNSDSTAIALRVSEVAPHRVH